MIYSATYESTSILISHLIKILIGFFLMIFFGIINIDFWKRYAFYLYFLGLILLIWASFFGYVGKGSRRWIEFPGFNFQPSELMKVLLIVVLAKFFDEKKIQDVKDYFFLILPISLIAIPVMLIISQPDLGNCINNITYWSSHFFYCWNQLKFFFYICGSNFFNYYTLFMGPT